MKNEELNFRTNPELLGTYQSGFKVAVNFLYHHHAEQDQPTFKQFLNANMPPEIVEEAINLRSTMGNCPPGLCDLGSGCVRCPFSIAFDGSYIS